MAGKSKGLKVGSLVVFFSNYGWKIGTLYREKSKTEGKKTVLTIRNMFPSQDNDDHEDDDKVYSLDGCSEIPLPEAAHIDSGNEKFANVVIELALQNRSLKKHLAWMQRRIEEINERLVRVYHEPVADSEDDDKYDDD